MLSPSLLRLCVMPLGTFNQLLQWCSCTDRKSILHMILYSGLRVVVDELVRLRPRLDQYFNCDIDKQ